MSVTASSESGPTATTAQRILFRPFSVFAAIALVVMGAILTMRHNSEWTGTYLRSSQLLLQGRDIYKELGSNTYPPFSAWLFIPLTMVPVHVAQAIWFLVSAASLVYLVKSSWRLAGGPPLEPVANLRSAGVAEIAACAIGNICVLQFAMNALTHLQTDLLIAALLMLGCAAIARGRYLRAAIWIGLSAAFKATPLLFAPYLVWRGQWRAAAVLFAVAIGANLLPNMITPPDRGGGGVWVGRWYQLYLRPMASANYTPGDWKNLLNNNQAISGAASRWVQTSWRDDPEGLNAPDKTGWSPAWVVRYFQERHPEWTANQVAVAASGQTVRGVFALLSVMAIAPAGYFLFRNRRGGEVNGANPSTVALECGVIMCLMLLLSPNSSRAHFCILFLPAFCVARMAVRRGASVWLRMALVAAAICSTLSIHIRLPFSYGSEQSFLWFGVVMWVAVFLLLASCRSVFRRHIHFSSN